MWYSEMKTLTKYDILVVVSNRLYLVLVIRFTYKIWGIDTYLPREGTETEKYDLERHY